MTCESETYVNFSNERTGGNYLKMRTGAFRLDIRKRNFTVMRVRHWNMLPREVVNSPSLQVFKRCGGLPLGSTILWF